MNENNVERIAKILAEDHGDPQAWGAYASKAMQIIEIAQDEWQPIETTPSNMDVMVGFWNEKSRSWFWVASGMVTESGAWVDVDDEYYDEKSPFAPTHWKHFSESPPAQEG